MFWAVATKNNTNFFHVNIYSKTNCLLNAKVTIYDRGRPFYCNKDFIRIPLAEGKLGEISNRIELYDRKVINLNISGFFTKKIIIDVI